MNINNLNLPWEINPGECREIVDSKGWFVCENDGEQENEFILEHICLSANSHASLVERVKELEAVAVSAQQRYDELYKAYYSQESRRDSLKEGNLLQQLHKLTDHLERMCIASEGKLTTECTLAADARQVLKETES